KVFADRTDAVQDLCDAGLLALAGPDDPDASYLFPHATVHHYLVASGLARQPGWLRTALAHVYEPAWQPVLQLLGGVLTPAQLSPSLAGLLRLDAADLLHRPFRLAVAAALQAGEALPEACATPLLQHTLSLYFDGPECWDRRERLTLLLSRGERVLPGLVRHAATPPA